MRDVKCGFVILAFALGLAIPAGAGDCKGRWTDPCQEGASVRVFPLGDGREMRVDVLSERIFRVRVRRDGRWPESAMNRYGMIARGLSGPTPEFVTSASGVSTSAAKLELVPGGFRLRSGVSAADPTVRPVKSDGGYEVSFSLEDGERLYGLGDASRENIMRRPGRYELWVRNVECYIPMPVVLSSRGWGVMMNTTWRNVFDIGAKDPDAMVCSADGSELDFYLFVAKDYRGLLDAYTSFSGRPALLPVFGYGFSFVCNQWIDQFSLFREAGDFRREQMPCDVLGLEPGWMEKFYDDSTRKTWNRQRFYFPYWMKPNSALTLPASLRRVGFKLSLWLCCNYDLTRYEEQLVRHGVDRSAVRRGEGAGAAMDEVWFDDHMDATKIIEDPRTADPDSPMNSRAKWEAQFPEGTLPWFEHLKKFVDQGVRCFKLDAAWQVDAWSGKPDREWANGMPNEAVHNLFPLVYARQMATGFGEHTGKRPMVYSACGYSGTQRYVATWAGDTGGGVRPCISMLNLGMSGHPNQSCDMDIFDVESLHFGFLQPWSQQNNWDYWNQPWMQEPGKAEVFRSYDRLRYRLLPYIYGAAAEASRTGWPIVRPLAFAYPDVPAYDTCYTTYMFGDDLLVSAFAKEVEIPEGVWHDFRTGETVVGPCRHPVEIRPDWGGSLYVRAGAIIPTWPVRQHVETGWCGDLTYEVWPSADGRATLYEDDGDSFDYRQGRYALTPLTLVRAGTGAELTIGKRSGTFDGMPSAHGITVVFHVDEPPQGATIGGVPTEGTYDADKRTFTVRLGQVLAERETRVTFR